MDYYGSIGDGGGLGYEISLKMLGTSRSKLSIIFRFFG
jgi:hypothetical protein